MRWIIAILFLLIYCQVYSEGTKELAPNANILVTGISTPDIAALFIGNNRYGNFANYNRNDAERLQVSILNASTESLMVGFSAGRFNNNIFGQTENNAPTQFRFFVKDPNGQVVYQSAIITENNAQIDTWEQAVAGPQGIVGPAGYSEINISSADLMSQGWNGAGDFYIEFDRIGSNNAFFIHFWDISVVDCNAGACTARQGRVWSEQWALFSTAVSRTGSVFSRPFNGSFFIVAPDERNPDAGFVTKMNFDGSQFRAAAFSVALNSFGASFGGSIQMNRRSVFDENTIIGEYPVFLNDPVDIYQTAELGSLQIIGAEGCLPDNYCIKAISSDAGEIEILIDLNGADKLYTPNSADVLINYRIQVADVNQEVCIPWDGRDGLGAIFEGMDFDSFTVITSFRQGIYHFPIFDAEINNNGFRLEAVRPLGLNPKMYYDDSNIPFGSSTGSPNINLGGCETPCHTWSGDVGDASYGNDNTINSWWYARTLIDEAKVILKFNKSLDTDVSFCAGSSTQIGDSTITAAGLYEFIYPTAAGCDSVVTIAVHRVDLTSSIVAESYVVNCFFPDIELSSTLSNPTNGISFLWSVPDSQNINDLTASSISISTPGVYMLTTSESTIGCDNISEIEILEDFIEPTIILENEKSLPCYNIERQLNVSIAGAVDFSVFWTSTDGNIVDGVDGLRPRINQPGTYIISAQNSINGCVSEEGLTVVRDSTTYLTISSVDQVRAEFCEIAKLNIDLNSTLFDSIRWLPSADLSCIDCISPDLFVSQDEVFQVVVTDTNGCSATKSIEVKVNEDFKLYVPNAFSPNNDGINDEIKIYSSPCEVDIVSFSIFDRWGNKVFERSDFVSTADDMGWDGFYQDKAMDAGSYIYQASVRTFRDEIVQLQGDVQLTR